MKKIEYSETHDLAILDKFHREYDKYEHSLDKNVKILSTKQNKKMLSNKKSVIFLLALFKNKPIGLIEYEKRGKLGIIHNLIITKYARGNGTGTSMVKIVQRKLKKQGCEKIRSYVRIKNIKALQFWKKQGYTPRLKGFGYRIKKTLK